MPSKKPSRFYETGSAANENTEDVESRPSLVLRDYLEDNYTLFALIGIFGALAVYLNQLGEDIGQSSPTLRVGVVGCLAIVLVVVLLLASDFLTRIGGGDEILNLLLSRENEKRPLLLFLLPFSAVVYTFVSVLGNFPTSVSVLFQFGAFALGLIGGAKVAYKMQDSIYGDADDPNLVRNDFWSAAESIIITLVPLSVIGYLAESFRSSTEETLGSTQLLYVNGDQAAPAVFHAFILGFEIYFAVVIGTISTVIAKNNIESVYLLLRKWGREAAESGFSYGRKIVERLGYS